MTLPLAVRVSALALALAASAEAQESRIYGNVVDASNSVLPGVIVTAQNSRTGLTQTAVTNERGQYDILGIPRGTYDVKAELAGFRTSTRTGVDVGLDSQVPMDFVLDVGSLAESITVTGEAPVVDARRAEVGANVTDEQIQNLPVQGRQWIDLATLLPGTGQDAIRGRYYNSVNIGAGINFYSNGFYVDGVSNNWQQQGEPRQDFPENAIAEFRVRAFSFPAQYGWAQGGMISTVTKSGTNQFHGDAFWFYRTKALNARTIVQTEKPDFRRHQFGGSFGGPIVPNRAQFFFSAERTELDEFVTVNTRGVFPSEEGTFVQPSFNNMYVARYDQAIDDRHRVFVRIAGQSNQRDYIGTGGTTARDAGSSFAAPRLSAVVGHTWVLPGNAVNDFRFQYGKATFQGWPTPSKFTEVGNFSAERVQTIPTVIIRPSLTTGNQSSFLGPEPRWQLKNDFSRVIGAHELGVGVDLSWIRWQNDNLVGAAGTFTFATDAPFDPANRATYPFLFTQRLAPRNLIVRSTEHAAYVQDTWRMSDRLTTTLGLRYDVQHGVWLENLFDQEQPEVRLGDRVLQAAGLLPRERFPFWQEGRGDNNNFGPRVGLAWDVRGNGREVVRAGFGVYYNRYRANASANELDLRASQVIIQNPSYPDPYGGGNPFDFASVANIFRIQGNENRNPFTRQYSLGYGRQVGANLGMSVDFTMANGSNQHTTIDRNYFASPEDRARGIRPTPQFGRITEDRTDGRLRYRSLEIRADRRMSGRWQFLASYTLAFAEIDAEGLPADQFDRAADYGYATADRRHRGVLSGILDVYRGIQVSGILQYQSSLPLDVTAGRDLNLDGLANDRPGGIQINDGCRGVDLGVVNAYRSANGAAPVESITCGDFLTLNTQVSRTFRLRGEHRVGIIFQVFNLLNRANRLPAVGNALSPLFGQALQVANARQGEIAIRYDF